MMRSYLSTIAVAVFAVGCRSPWPDSNVMQPQINSPSLVQASHSDNRDASANLDQPASATADVSSQEIALKAVLDDLEGIEAIEPAAKAELMDDLRQARPENWSLVIRQFQSALAYRRQLSARESVKRLADTSAYELPPQLPTSVPTFPRTSTPKEIRLPHGPTTSAVSSKIPSHLGHHSTIASDAQPLATLPLENVADTQKLPPPPTKVLPTVASNRPGRTVIQQASYAADAAKPKNWQSHLLAAVRELEQSVPPTAETTDDVHAHMRLRMLQLMAGEEEAAMQSIPGASTTQQDFWNRQLYAISTLLDSASQPDARRRATGSLVHFDRARASLVEMATLQVRNLNFVEQVDGFGVYQPIGQSQFRPGEQVSLYTEVQNFRSKSTKDGFRTKLSTSYEVLDQNDHRVAGAEFPDVEDLCRNQRRDFHMQYGVTLPTQIYPGHYLLRLTITDQLSQKIGQTSIPFEIVE